MAKITSAERKSLPASKFAMPKERKYPVDTRGRAANAKSRASEMEHRGKLSKSEESKIDRAADRVLSKAKRK
jgi:hypothetical protein